MEKNFMFLFRVRLQQKFSFSIKLFLCDIFSLYYLKLLKYLFFPVYFNGKTFAGNG